MYTCTTNKVVLDMHIHSTLVGAVDTEVCWFESDHNVRGLSQPDIYKGYGGYLSGGKAAET